MMTGTDVLLNRPSKTGSCMGLESAILTLLQAEVDHDGLLAEIDRGYANDPEALYAWTESRWAAYEEQFQHDPDELQRFLPVDLENVEGWSSTVDRVAKQGFYLTLRESDNREPMLRQLLVVLYHPVALGSLYYRLFSTENELPAWAKIDVEKKGEQLCTRAEEGQEWCNGQLPAQTVWQRLRTWVRRNGRTSGNSHQHP